MSDRDPLIRLLQTINFDLCCVNFINFGTEAGLISVTLVMIISIWICDLIFIQLAVHKCNECGQDLPENFEAPADEPWTTGIFGCTEDMPSCK